ncbi:hypothetical protein [Candidatus Phaeomarinobacter ectocarpi]|nr:hypothetical protein [Candidatus Phaeomarinobacter ectocarpi]
MSATQRTRQAWITGCLTVTAATAGAIMLLSGSTGTANAQGAASEACSGLGLKIESHISGDIPLGGPISLASRRAVDRDVTMEDDIAARLANLGFKIDDNAFWQFVYETDNQHPKRDPNFTIRSEVQGGREPEAVGQYRFDRDGDVCSPLSTYTMDFEVLDEGARVVWRGHATYTTRTQEPVADKERLTERLISAFRSDLKQSHNLSGRGRD